MLFLVHLSFHLAIEKLHWIPILLPWCVMWIPCLCAFNPNDCFQNTQNKKARPQGKPSKLRGKVLSLIHCSLDNITHRCSPQITSIIGSRHCTEWTVVRGLDLASSCDFPTRWIMKIEFHSFPFCPGPQPCVNSPVPLCLKPACASFWLIDLKFPQIGLKILIIKWMNLVITAKIYN